jgi:hypothetical protein
VSVSSLQRLREASQIFALVKRGASIPEIAAVMDLSEERVRVLIGRHERQLQVSLEDKVKLHREAALGRLEELLEILYPAALAPKVLRYGATRPNYEAIDRVLKVIDRQRKLMGLDAPRKLEVQGEVGVNVDANVNLSMFSTAELEQAADMLKGQLRVLEGGLGDSVKTG